MKRSRSDLLLWSIFIATLIVGLYFAISGHRPTQQIVMLELLGIGCGLIAMVRRRRNQ